MLFLALGGTSIYAAIRYAVGAGTYGYLGLGDVFVFLFFRLLSMPGSYFYTRARSMRHCCCRHARAGCLNNMRDIQNDALKGKRTIPVRIGLRRLSAITSR